MYVMYIYPFTLQSVPTFESRHVSKTRNIQYYAFKKYMKL